MSDEEIESKVHDAVVEETVTRAKGSGRVRIRITIKDFGEGFITKKQIPKDIELKDGTPIVWRFLDTKRQRDGWFPK